MSWHYGFVDDTNLSTASKSPSKNVEVLNKAAEIAVRWAHEDEATFEKSKTELVHHSPGRTDLSDFHVMFDGENIRPADAVKWLGVWLDSKLNGDIHIKSRKELSRLVWRSLMLSGVSNRSWYGI
jgi:hypothetical protein